MQPLSMWNIINFLWTAANFHLFVKVAEEKEYVRQQKHFYTTLVNNKQKELLVSPEQHEPKQPQRSWWPWGPVDPLPK